MHRFKAACTSARGTRALVERRVLPRAPAGAAPSGGASRGIVSGTTNGIAWYNASTSNPYQAVRKEQWHLVTLGTSSSVPTRYRNVSASLLRTDRSALLFDCGEGTVRQLQSCLSVTGNSIEAVFITHLHGDHVYGLPGFVASWYDNERKGQATAAAGGPTEAAKAAKKARRLAIYGPRGLHKLLTAAFTTMTPSQLRAMPLDVYELLTPRDRDLPADAGGAGGIGALHYVRPEADGSYQCLMNKHLSVCAAPLQHSTTCFGYVVQERDRTRFDPRVPLEHGLTPGPAYAALQRGEAVTAPDGVVIRPEDVLSRYSSGRKAVILGDNCDASAIVPLAQGADIVLHEATIPGNDETKAMMRQHSTPRMAGRFAAAVNAKRLVLTHFSPKSAPYPAESSVEEFGRAEVNAAVKAFILAHGGGGGGGVGAYPSSGGLGGGHGASGGSGVASAVPMRLFSSTPPAPSSASSGDRQDARRPRASASRSPSAASSGDRSSGSARFRDHAGGGHAAPSSVAGSTRRGAANTTNSVGSSFSPKQASYSAPEGVRRAGRGEEHAAADDGSDAFSQGALPSLPDVTASVFGSEEDVVAEERGTGSGSAAGGSRWAPVLRGLWGSRWTAALADGILETRKCVGGVVPPPAEGGGRAAPTCVPSDNISSLLAMAAKAGTGAAAAVLASGRGGAPSETSPPAPPRPTIAGPEAPFIFLTEYSYPPIRETSTNYEYVALAQAAFGKTAVVCARDFMAFPIPLDAVKPPKVSVSKGQVAAVKAGAAVGVAAGVAAPAASRLPRAVGGSVAGARRSGPATQPALDDDGALPVL